MITTSAVPEAPAGRDWLVDARTGVRQPLAGDRRRVCGSALQPERLSVLRNAPHFRRIGWWCLRFPAAPPRRSGLVDRNEASSAYRSCSRLPLYQRPRCRACMAGTCRGSASCATGASPVVRICPFGDDGQWSPPRTTTSSTASRCALRPSGLLRPPRPPAGCRAGDRGCRNETGARHRGDPAFGQ
jgi:hypothetical protein